MGLLTWIKDRIREGLVGYGGTITTETDDDEYPIAIANELLGGSHGYRTLEELSEVPTLRLSAPMAAIVSAHTRPDGSAFPTSFLIFNPTSDDWNDLLGYNKISAMPDYDLSLFWKSKDAVAGELETQYAPEVDYGSVSGPGAPAFQPPIITAENYQSGYKSDADHSVIWSDTYDSTIHKYIRQRVGSTGKWGIPIKTLGETYAQGDYIDNQFKWVAKDTVPSTPRTLVNGVRNNNPEGWQATPDVPGGIPYYTYVATHDLYRISVSKDAHQDIKSDWSTPIKISTDPTLVRYGTNPSSTDFIGDSGEDTSTWRGYYTPGDTYMAVRVSTSSIWRIDNIDHEDGEYVDYIFKAFPVGYEPIEADRPTIPNPFSEDISAYPNNKFKDYPFVPADNEVLHRSVGRKYNNGDLKPSGWSIPTQADGQDIIQAVIVPNTTTVFKYDSGGVVSPSTIELVAKFFRGKDEVGSAYTIEWYHGVYDVSNKIIKDSVIGVSANHTITGDNNEILTITPAAVDSVQLYTVRVFFNGEDYYDSQTIIDVSDAQGYLAVIESDSGFVFKNEIGTKNFTAKLYNNGIAVPNGSLTFQWLLGVNDITPVSNKHTVAITGAEFTDKETLKAIITVDGLSFNRTETLVDLQDAIATIWNWSSVATTPDEDTVWSSIATDAIWARISTDGGATWSEAFRVRGESAPFNGGFHRNVYKNAVTIPTASGLTSDLFPNPSTDWTDSMTERTGDENTWQTGAFFLKKPYNDDGTPNTNTALTTANWIIQGTWGTVVRINGEDSTSTGDEGPPGPVGWTPVLSNVDRVNSDSSVSVVQKVSDWINLGGADIDTKPVTGIYLTTTGYTSDISAAKNIRGSQGPSGSVTVTGTAIKVSSFVNFDNFTKGETDTSGVKYWGFSEYAFRTPDEVKWKPYLTFTCQITGDSSTTEVVRFQVQRRLIGGSWSTLSDSNGNNVQDFTTSAGAYTVCVIHAIDSAAAKSTSYEYRLYAYNVKGGDNYFSRTSGCTIHLVPVL